MPGADPGFFLGGGAPLRNGVTEVFFFFLQNISCIRKLQVISREGGWVCTLPQYPSLDAAVPMTCCLISSFLPSQAITRLPFVTVYIDSLLNNFRFDPLNVRDAGVCCNTRYQFPKGKGSVGALLN